MSTAADDTRAVAGDTQLLRVRDLQTHFSDRQGIIARLTRRKTGEVRAVDGVSFDVVRGETLGLVGESGSGKSTLARTVMGLVPATGGSALLDGRELIGLRPREWRPLRRRMQMIFQDPVSSLSPRFRVSFLLKEPYVINDVPAEKQSSVDELLTMVGLSAEQAASGLALPHLAGPDRSQTFISRAWPAAHPRTTAISLQWARPRRTHRDERRIAAGLRRQSDLHERVRGSTIA